MSYRMKPPPGVVLDTGTASGGLAVFEETITTASLADGATETFAITTLGRTALLREIEADVACWVRAYDTSAARTADAGRAITTSPHAGRGILSNAAPGLDAAPLALPITPGHVLANRDDPRTATIYGSITNKSGAEQTVSVTFRGLTLEN